MATAVLGPVVAVALASALTACSADDPAHRSFRPQEITASGIPYTGNGIAALDPQAIVTKTVKATSSAPTAHVTGTLSGVPVSGGTFTVDMVFTQFGAVGDVTSGSATSRLLRVEDEVWTAEPSSFWKEIGAIDNGKAYGGLYVRIPIADPRYAGFTNDTRIGYLLDRLLLTSATWAKGKVGTVNGENALELDGTGRDGHKASIWVATDGVPYILRIAPTAGSYQGRIDFTDYEDRVAIQAPLPGEVLDNALIVLPPTSSPSASSNAYGSSGSASPTASSRSTGPTKPPTSPSATPSSTASGLNPPSPSASPSATPSGPGHGHG
ncbi:hypothetical protein [Actinocrinis sp.]|jgi:hypothetical protein|uniref:hypothetical protein n=1 Tax=Actinocrinis sp. TaxID=1920516 RepID=UPI002BE362FF|nr:hypothetical protein [Actinocrinis sp.]HXR71680.1 hypothetical protein [Actinocrinis sp.]